MGMAADTWALHDRARGVVALAIIPVTTLATVLVLGWILTFSGILEAVHGFRVRSSHSVFLHLIGGVLGVLIGLLVVTHPVAGALASRYSSLLS